MVQPLWKAGSRQDEWGGRGLQCAVLDGVDSKGLREKEACEQRLERYEGMSLTAVGGKSIAGEGNNKEVYEYVMGFEESEKLYQKIYDMVKFMLPLYKKDNKQHLSIGIGCSGGQHRSVAFVNRLAEDLGNNKKIKVLKKHREGDKSHWT